MSAELLHVPAPAKLNLFLHVVGRRPDGMHLLESVFVLVDLADDIELESTEDGTVTRTGDVVGDIEKDLCVRAARALQKASGTGLGCQIGVKKRIPAGAGMGGGSSDCASTLLGLNRLWNLNWPREKLLSLGDTLGADVPFFVFGRNAFARGTGAELEEVRVPDGWAAVVMPASPTSTALIFQDPSLTRDTKSLKIPSLSEQLAERWPVPIGHNDLQPVAERINPEISSALKALGAEARMTGSGSAVFALFADEAGARRALESVPAGMRGYAVKILRTHPFAG